MNEHDQTDTARHDDTQGHGVYVKRADEESVEGADDTEGHTVFVKRADAESAEGDDAEGHRYSGS